MDGSASDASAQLIKYLPVARKNFGRSLKKARTFETQRLIKKLKRVRQGKGSNKKEDENVDDLEAQLTALKNVDLDTLAVHTIRTRLSKLAKSVTVIDEALETFEKDSFASSSDPKSPQNKAVNRILASKAAVDEWADVLFLIKERANLNPEGERPRKVQQQQKQGSAAQKRPVKQPSSVREAQAPAVHGQVDSDNDDSADEQESDEGEDIVDEDDEVARELAQFSQDDLSEDESDEALDLPRHESEAASSESDTSSDGSDQAVSRMLSPERKDRKQQTRKLATSSAFLPSLASGYVSFSDDDEDAQWIKQGDRDELKADRKNRPGQRARRALWEKKYGEQAKHVVKARKERGSDATHLVSSNLRGSRLVQQQKELERQHKAEQRALEHRQKQSRAGTQATGQSKPPRPGNANLVEVNQSRAAERRNQNAKTSGPVHPSWEAKRKAQEALQAAPSGKKIKFD